MSSIAQLSSLLLPHFSTLTQSNLANIKKVIAQDYGRLPKNSELRAAYFNLLNLGKIQANPEFTNLFTTKKIRTGSGVTPFAVMTKPYPCPGQCTYCPLETGMPKSYLSDEPAAARAKKFAFDPARQIRARLEQLTATGHETGKLELIVIGGTFSNYPEKYKRSFFQAMVETVNGFSSSSLAAAQTANETASRRIVGISIETRPDWINAREVRLLRELGVTKVQLGVQALDEKILMRVKRNHSLAAVTAATRLLKDAGIKVCYHFMPNLPGSNPDHDVEMAQLMYEDSRFKPDFLKIYPVQVIEGTELFRQWSHGEYQPYGDDTLKSVLTRIKKITPPFVRIDRLVRDISKGWVSAGTHHTNLRQVIQKEMVREGTFCRCIRCREARGRSVPKNIKLLKLPISTYGGREYLLSFENKDILYSLLRLRLPDRTFKPLFAELKNSALIREVHTYGATLAVGRVGEQGKSQHLGLGKRLIAHAESLAKTNGYQKIAVISAIGTREYYRSLGYRLEGYYMTKLL